MKFNFFLTANFFFKVSQINKIRKLSLSNDDWELILKDINLLKPFFMSTTLLQTQCYHTLSTGKIIETTLTKYFEKKISEPSCHVEKLLSQSLLNNIDKYLNEKISLKQKNFMLVIIFKKCFKKLIFSLSLFRKLHI